MSFGSVFKKLRISKNLSQEQLATELGLSRSAIGMYEQGKRTPDFETLEAIADYFNVDMNYLLGSKTITVQPNQMFPKEIVDNMETFLVSVSPTELEIMESISQMDERKLVLLLAYIKALNGDD